MNPNDPQSTPTRPLGLRGLAVVVGLAVVASCAGPSASPVAMTSGIAPTGATLPLSVTPPSPDPRVGLEPGARA